MSPGEQAILNEISNTRKAFEKGLKECRDDIRRVHVRIDNSDEKIDEVEKVALVNKTKVGTFIAGMTFVFTGIGALISHYVKSLIDK